MATIIEIIYRDYIEKYKRMILIVFLLILFIIASVYAYNWYGKPKINKPIYDDVANANRREKTAEVLLFSTIWCPHCVKAKIPWDKFTKATDGTVINGYKISCINIDCTDGEANPEIQAQIQKYNIEHYPTVKMLINDKIIDYEASVTEPNLSNFVNTITNQA
jgi:thiol-disulfide isomerase/thioredoxin